MKKNIKTLSTYLTVGLMAIAGSGCNAWLDLKPDNKQISDDYWQTKEEVDAVVQSMYVGLRDCEEKFFYWGELRGDMLGLGTANQKYKDVKLLNINPDNDNINSWEHPYKVIGRANSILDYGDRVLDRDITFAESLLRSYKGEAKFIRALCYFYLVRSFGDIPYVANAFVTDQGGQSKFRIAKTNKEEVYAGIMDDLMGDRMESNNGMAGNEWYTDASGVMRRTNGAIHWCKPGYGSPDLNKGRATRWAAYTLLADVSLWTEDYAITLNAIEKIEGSTQDYDLTIGLQWYSMFAFGNDRFESIFELQWRNNKTNIFKENTFIKTNFSNTSTTLTATTAAMNLYEPEDIRGTTASFQSDGRIWKHGGYNNSNDPLINNRGSWDNGWIFYRYAEVILMKLEAQVMTTNDYSSPDFLAKWDQLNRLRRRANLATEIPIPSTQEEALKSILEEKAREFLMEGKRWFDLHRIAKKNNYTYKNSLIEILLADIDASNRPRFLAKLQDENGYYFPIPQRDIDASGIDGKGNLILEQNDYYKGTN